MSDFLVALHSVLFDARSEVRSLAFTDGVAALEAVFVGRHIGEFAGIPATGIVVRLPYAVCYAVPDGMISELRAYFPILALIEQLKPGTHGTHAAA